MGAINVGNGRGPWVVAGWAFRGYLQHVLAEVRDDPELGYLVEQAMALDGLHLPLKDTESVHRLAPVLLRVADEVVSGARPVHIEGRLLDERSQEQFREAVAELRAMLAAG
jgi:hypothetical protein